MSTDTWTMEGLEPEGESLDALVRRAQQGEEAAFEEILSRFEGRALAIASHLGAGRADAEDIAQEAFLKLFRHIRSYRGGRRFTSWFYRIVVNAARDHFHRAELEAGAGSRAGAPGSSDEAAGAERAAVEAGGGAEAAAEGAELALRMRQALLRLSAREREVIILRDLHGLTTWEVSRILGLNPVTVRRHAMQARLRLKDLLGE